MVAAVPAAVVTAVAAAAVAAVAVAAAAAVEVAMAVAAEKKLGKKTIENLKRKTKYLIFLTDKEQHTKQAGISCAHTFCPLKFDLYTKSAKNLRLAV